jgi:hypothetical protein
MSLRVYYLMEACEFVFTVIVYPEIVKIVEGLYSVPEVISVKLIVIDGHVAELVIVKTLLVKVLEVPSHISYS